MSRLTANKFLRCAAAALLAGCLAIFGQSPAGQHAPVSAKTHVPTTVNDVVQLLQHQVSEDVICAQIRSKEQAFDLTADDLIQLKKNGASDRLLRVMMDCGPSARQPSRQVQTAVQPKVQPAVSPRVQWISHTDPTGFRVSLPIDWPIRVDRTSGRILIEGPEGQRAIIWPTYLEHPFSDGQKAAAFLQRAVRTMDERMKFGSPEIAQNVVRILAREDPPGAALLRWNPSPAGTVLCVFFVSAPQGSYRASAGIFQGILTTFELLPDSKPPDAHAITAVDPMRRDTFVPVRAPITWTQWTDPNERAFGASVPQDWPVSGGSFRRSATDIRKRVLLFSPDRQIQITLGDENLPVFSAPNPMFARFQRPGSLETLSDGSQLVIRPYVPAGQFLREYVASAVGRFCQGVQIGAVNDRSDMVEASLRDVRSKGSGASARATAAGLEFTCDVNGQQMAGYYAAATVLVRMGPSTLWYVDPLYGYIAPPVRKEEAEGVSNHVLRSLGINPEWQQSEGRLAQRAVAIDNERSQEIQAEARRSIAQNQQQMSRSIVQGYETRSKVYDEIARKRENSILGTLDVVDPSTGAAYKVSNYSDFHWMNNSGVISGTQTDTSPGSDWHKLTTLP